MKNKKEEQNPNANDIEQLKKEVNKRKKELEALYPELEKLQKENEKQQTTLNKLQLDINPLRESLLNAKIAYEQLKRTEDFFETTSKELDKLEKNYYEELRTYELQNDKIQNLRRENENLRKTIQRRNIRIGKYEDFLRGAEQTLNHLSKRSFIVVRVCPKRKRFAFKNLSWSKENELDFAFNAPNRNPDLKTLNLLSQQPASVVASEFRIEENLRLQTLIEREPVVGEFYELLSSLEQWIVWKEENLKNFQPEDWKDGAPKPKNKIEPESFS